MATCANCIHHSLCDYNTNVSGNGKIRLVYAEGADMKCSFFQNTDDVAPKSEVAREIDDIKRYIIFNENISRKCKAENGEQNEEYWKGKLSAFLQVRGYIEAELKKKYI